MIRNLVIAVSVDEIAELFYLRFQDIEIEYLCKSCEDYHTYDVVDEVELLPLFHLSGIVVGVRV